MSINKNTDHTGCLIIFNKTHASHICSQIKNLIITVYSLIAIFSQTQIQYQVIRITRNLVPFIQRFQINSSHNVTFFNQFFYQVPANKTSCTCYNNLFHNYKC